MPNNSKAAFTGTFDPITNGHIDLVERAAKMFPQVLVAVAKNSSKQPLFGLNDRLEFARKALAHLPNVVVKSYTGMTVHFLQAENITVMLRGLRNGTDLDYEWPMVYMNQHLVPNIETIFLAPAQQYSHVSSSLVKEVAKFGGDITPFVTPLIATALGEKYA